jgi:predicted RNA-binding Zn ribbon-like protein
VDFVRYAERAADLVNAPLEDDDALLEHLGDRAWLRDRVTDKDASVLGRFQGELRPVFQASDHHDEPAVVAGLNTLLAKYPITPCISSHDAHGWHMHVADGASSVAGLLIAESLMGLATLVCDLGATRLGVCHGAPCRNVFVDTSPNQSRRYCSDRCSSRANVAAYRARQRAVAGG